MSFPPNLGITSSFIIDAGSSLFFHEFPSLVPPLDGICSPFSRNKMNGYSRIKKHSTTRSKSVDFADLDVAHRTPRSTLKSQETKPNLSNALKITTMHNSIPEHEPEEGVGEAFGIILGRKCPIPSLTPDQKVVAENETPSSFQTAVRRTLSIRRSASVSEGYSRIHQQPNLSAEDEDQCRTEVTSKNSVKKKGKFFKACKRLLGL